MPSADTGLLALGGGTPIPGKEKTKRPAQRLLVYATDPEKARSLANAVLQDLAKTYKLKGTRNGGNDRYVLEYRVRTRKKSPAGAIVDRLNAEGIPYVVAAELLTEEEKAESGKAPLEKA
jgi:hypothetical protein